MQKKLSILTLLIILIGLFSTMPMTLTAQDSEPTSIPVLPATTDESAAPSAPNNIAPPVVSDTTSAESTIEPEATAEIDSSSDTSTPIEQSNDLVEQLCPVAVEDSFTATEILCSDVASGEACIGNGRVDSVFNADVGTAFSQANDRVQLTSLEQMSLASGSTWTVMRAQLELATTDGGDIATGTLFAYGNLTLTDTGRVASGSAQNGTVIAARGMNVRRTPGNDGVAVWQLQGGQQIIVTGISADREWIRMIIPNEFAGTGWVYAPYIEVDGGDETLAIVNEGSPIPDLAPPEFAPAQSYELLSAPAIDGCDAPVSGLLLQSPSGTPDALRLQINNAEIQISGTVFIQALVGEVLRISVLEGQATAIANGSEATAMSDSRINVPLDINLVVNGAPQVEAFNVNELTGVPTRILPRQIAFGLAPIEEIEVPSEVVAEEATSSDISPAEETPVFGTPQASEVEEETVAETPICTLTAPDEVRNVRAGASTQFDIVQVLEANQSTTAVGQAIGELNLTWYQTDTGGWIRVDTIDSDGDCSALPVVEAPDLPEPSEDVEASTDNTSGSALSSTELASLTCDGATSVTGSSTSDGTDTSVSIGGTWTARAGTSITITTNGGMFRPEFAHYIKLINSDGTEIALSGEERRLSASFETDTTFEARFSAANGDVVLMAVSCE